VKPSAEHYSLGPDWIHVRGGRVIKAATPPTAKLASGPVTESPTRSEVTITRAKRKTAKSKAKVGPKQAPVTKSNKPAK
jgi:hypothetical protein